jgi:hypothetical protein
MRLTGQSSSARPKRACRAHGAIVSALAALALTGAAQGERIRWSDARAAAAPPTRTARALAALLAPAPTATPTPDRSRVRPFEWSGPPTARYPSFGDVGAAMPALGIGPQTSSAWDVSVLAALVRQTTPIAVMLPRHDRSQTGGRREGADEGTDLVVVAFPPPLWIALLGLGVAAGTRRHALAAARRVRTRP